MWNPDQERDPLTHAIIGAAIRVRGVVGVGLLESAYDRFLAHEMRKVGLRFSMGAPCPAVYDGIRVELAYRTDFVVEDSVIIESKTVSAVLPVHKAQLLTYMRLSAIPVGLLINFHAVPFIKGIHRLTLDLPSA